MKIDGIMNEFDAIPRRGWPQKLTLVTVGPYGNLHIAVWDAYDDAAIELAAEWLEENAPGHLTSEDEMTELYQEAAEELGVDWPIKDWNTREAEEVREAAEADMMYTESGWLTSYEIFIDSVPSTSDIYADAFVMTMDRLMEEGDLDEDDMEEANALAEKLGIDAVWED